MKGEKNPKLLVMSVRIVSISEVTVANINVVET